jgi:hypothetical protein
MSNSLEFLGKAATPLRAAGCNRALAQSSQWVLIPRSRNGRPLTGGEYEAPKQIEGRILLVGAGLLFERASAQLSYGFFCSA